MHDLDFNPENDRQAESRAHRMGQSRPVTIYKMVCSDTVDEEIFELSHQKSIISNALLHKNEAQDDFINGKDPIGLDAYEESTAKTVSVEQMLVNLL